MLSIFKQTYDNLDKSNIAIIDNLYAEDVVFIDPFHEIHTRDNLSQYFAQLYQNVDNIRFDFHHEMSNGNEHYIAWEMALEHPKLNQGIAFVVAGTTFLKNNEQGKVYYHRDYFDAGAMLYEQVPVIGPVVKWLKKKL
jgi:ketosteroid isomerase-like protein